MYGYSYAYPSSVINGGLLGFNPLNVRGLQLLLTMKNPTPASWLDQSPNAFAFNQAIVLKQPIVGALSVDYDGVDDFQMCSAVQPLNDSSGIMFFSWFSDGVTSKNFISSSDDSVDNKVVAFQELAGGEIRIIILNGGVTTAVTSTNKPVVGYNYAYIKSTGTSYGVGLNGVVEVPVPVVGLDDGTWFADVLGRKNLALASGQRLTPFYTPDKTNKILYSNANLTTAEINDVNLWMSDPNNK